MQGHDAARAAAALVEERLSDPGARHALSGSARDADAVLYVENPDHKGRGYIGVLGREEPLARYPDKCFAYDWEDDPPGFLSGVYPSMPADRLASAGHRFRSGGFLLLYNDLVEVMRRDERRATLLASFRGALSHPVRARLLEADLGPDVAVSRSTGWFDHDVEQRRAYVEELLRSKFALCPRGYGVATHRLFEAMALGVAPVVLSDGWVPPAGPRWDDFLIRVPEQAAAGVRTVLEEHEPRWRELGEAARSAYEQWFAPSVSPLHLVDQLEDLLAARPVGHREESEHERWTSFRFAWKAGWTLPQRSAAAARKRVRPS
jgi:hypothetical protein